MCSPAFFGEKPSVDAVTKWLAGSKEKFFSQVFQLQRFLVEKVEGLDIRIVTPQMIPGCCAVTAPAITAALRKKGCSAASTVQGLFNNKTGHAWTVAPFGNEDHVVCATYSQFLFADDAFYIFPAKELPQWNLVRTGAGPEFHDPLEKRVEERYRKEFRRLIEELLASLLCGGAVGNEFRTFESL